jgi:hypothetical protein
MTTQTGAAFSAADKAVLRPLAEQYAEGAADPIQRERRDLWRAHNSLKRTRPLIYVRAFAWPEMPESRLECADGLARACENALRQRLFWMSFNDDSVFEPWYTLKAAVQSPPEGPWGLRAAFAGAKEEGRSRVPEPSIVEPEDAAKMVVPEHRVDEEETQRRYDLLDDAFGDVLPVVVDRAPLYRSWHGDISTQLFYLRGMDEWMMDMMLRPEWLHGVLAFMRDGIIKTHEEAEAAGDWRLCAHENQAMPYAEELEDPSTDPKPVQRADLWYFCASQELTGVGPAQFDEFMFQYQYDIMKPFGLVAYGCCEDLSLKIDVIRRLPNLRRIAVSPMANVAKCAEAIGSDYVSSYRPSPADMVSYDFDPERVRRITKRDLETLKANDCHVDITLKDVETVQGDPSRVREWVRLTREVIVEAGLA